MRVISVQCSVPPLAAEAASLTKEETDERRTSNAERPMLNTVFCRSNKLMKEFAGDHESTAS